MLDGLFIPSSDSNSSRLFIVLHGLGDSASGWKWFPTAMDLPWMNYFLVNAPDDYFGGFSWFEYPGDISPGVQRSRRLLFDLLDQMRARGFAADNITLGGFSQGCLMSIETGLRYQHRLAGIVGISGWVFEVDNLLQELPPEAKSQRLILTHGIYDPILPVSEVREQVFALKNAGMNVSWHEFPKEHTVHGAEEVAILRRFVASGYQV